MFYISIHWLLEFYDNVKNIKKNLYFITDVGHFFLDTYLQAFLKICIEQISNKCIKEKKNKMDYK